MEILGFWARNINKRLVKTKIKIQDLVMQEYLNQPSSQEYFYEFLDRAEHGDGDLGNLSSELLSILASRFQEKWQGDKIAVIQAPNLNDSRILDTVLGASSESLIGMIKGEPACEYVELIGYSIKGGSSIADLCTQMRRLSTEYGVNITDHDGAKRIVVTIPSVPRIFPMSGADLSKNRIDQKPRKDRELARLIIIALRLSQIVDGYNQRKLEETKGAENTVFNAEGGLQRDLADLRQYMQRLEANLAISAKDPNYQIFRPHTSSDADPLVEWLHSLVKS
jgi:hypothetical protein